VVAPEGETKMSIRSVSRGQGVVSVALVAAFIGGCTGSPPAKPGSGSAGSGGGNTGTGGSGIAGTGGSTGTAGKGGTGTAGTGGSTGTAGNGSAGNGAGATAGSGATGTAGAQGNGGTGAGGSSACANPQTTFAFTGQGDTNPHFNSAVGARSTNALFLFSGYIGPDPNADGGGPNVYEMFAQAFDPSTGASLGPSKLLIPGGSDENNSSFNFLFSAAIAPTGQIVVVNAGAVEGVPSLRAAFLTPSSDAGVGLGGGVGLQLERQVVVTSSYSADGNDTPPQVIWSNASNSFLLSYGTSASGNYGIAIAEYSADGAVTLGGTFVPTDSSGGSENIRPSAGVSGNLVGVPFLSTLSSTKNYPGLSVLNSQGTQVGSSIYIANAAVAYAVTIAVAGTPQGFVAAFSEQSSTLVTFVPTSSSGIVTDGGAFPPMTLLGTVAGGNGLLAVGDDVGTGGANGVGVALQLSSGVLSFAYVSADGSKMSGPVSVLPWEQSNQFSITNYNGSTVLTLSGPSNFSAQIAASGCH
jgi:hypothetical protein